MDFLAIFIAIIALLVTLWQAFLSKQQLEHAKETKTDTEKLLSDIKEKVNKIESISDETRKDVKEQVSKMIDKQNEHIQSLLETPQKSEQNQMIMQLLGPMLSNPDNFEKLIKITGTKR